MLDTKVNLVAVTVTTADAIVTTVHATAITVPVTVITSACANVLIR